MKCDICEKNEAIICGRWIAYCKQCWIKGERKDWEITYENEVERDLQEGNLEVLLSDGELSEMISKNL